MDICPHGEYLYNYDKIRISIENYHADLKGKLDSKVKDDKRHYCLTGLFGSEFVLKDKTKKIMIPENSVILSGNCMNFQNIPVDMGKCRIIHIDFKAELFGYVVRDYSDFSEMIKFLFDEMAFRNIDMREQYYYTDKSGKIRELFEISFKEYKERKFKWQDVVKNNIYEIILEFLRNFDYIEQVAVQYDLVQSIVDYCEMNWTRKLTVKEIADKFNYSESYITKLVKKELGRTLKDHIIQRKIYGASGLLKKDYKISEVAKMVGYDDVDLFNKFFKRYLGVSPSEYRKRIKELRPWYDDMKDLKEQSKK